MPDAGGWETKMPDYLTNVNPAGTVPVLIHNGHPVYESQEQIIYIDNVLMPKGKPALMPEDPVKKALVHKYVELGAMVFSEVIEAVDRWDGISKRAGNLLPVMTMPFFCANCILYIGPWAMLETLSMAPLVKDRTFIVFNMFFKIFGIEAFQRLKNLGDLLSQTRKGINHHFTTITKDLESCGGPYICGKDYTLADISMVPIFERMEVARWWTNSVKVRTNNQNYSSNMRAKCDLDFSQSQFPLVHQYWEKIQERKGYQDSKPDVETQAKLDRVGRQIDLWKHKHPWFNDFYEK